MIIDGVKITERGWAGHFMCAYRCQFHRNTLLEYEDKKWIVSTIGRMIDGDEGNFTTVGLGRYYETMAFEGQIEGDYIDIKPSRHVDFKSNWAIADCEYDSELRANEMHDKVVEELIEKIKG